MLIMLITSSQTTHTSPTRRPPTQVPNFFASTKLFYGPPNKGDRGGKKERKNWERLGADWVIPLYDGGHSEDARAPAYQHMRSREEIGQRSERRYAEEQSLGGR